MDVVVKCRYFVLCWRKLEQYATLALYLFEMQENETCNSVHEVAKQVGRGWSPFLLHHNSVV